MGTPNATSDGYTWPDPSDLFTRLREAQIEASQLRTQVQELEAENQRLERDLVHLTLHQGAHDARVGKWALWKAVFGPPVVHNAHARQEDTADTKEPAR